MYFIYTAQRDDLAELVKEEMSHVADRSYTKEGVSLYDSINVTSKDANLVQRFISDALDALVTRTYDIASWSAEDADSKVEFYLPDFDVSMTDAATKEITRFITLAVVTWMLDAVASPEAQQYAERTKSAQDKAVTLLKSRKQPK